MTTDRLADQVLLAARKRKLKLATAESCTGGMVAAALTDIPGSSDVFERGFVTYSYASKSDLLRVSLDTLARHGAVSQEVALEMVAGALDNSAADIAVAITGVAGPGASEAKPEGLVWIAAQMTTQPAMAQIHEFGPLGRSHVRRKSVDAALRLLLSIIEK